MDSKRKNIAKEPSEVYETSSKTDAIQDEIQPVLVKLLEKSIEQADKGQFLTTEEVMRRAKEKFPFLK